MHRKRGSGPTIVPDPEDLASLVSRAASGSGGPAGSSARPGLGAPGFPRAVAHFELGMPRVQEKTTRVSRLQKRFGLF